MVFHYVAADPSGKIQEGDLEGNNLQDALRWLAGKELRPVSVKPVEAKSKKEFGFRKGINTSDKVFLTKYLALMLRVGTDLLSAINILIEDFDKQAVRDFLLEVRENLSKGKPFYEAFANYPKYFSPTFISLVRAAEKSGNLQKTFEDLSVSLEKDAELESHIRAALIYPAVLLVIASGILVFLVTYALPKVADVFTSGGITPPLFSRIVFAVGLFIGNNILIIGPTVIAVIAAAVWFFWKTEPGRKLFDNTVIRLPLISTIYEELAVQRMASTMSSLLSAGLPISQAITIAADTVGLDSYRTALLRITKEGLEKGLTIGEAFKRETVFPKMVTNLVAISEKAGHLEEVLNTLAEFYAANVDSNITMLVSLLEPAMLLIMGVMVGTIAL
ncbi:MAG: type II secretion system F family protein, partial [Chthoniobacter sp.]|nr:type II secretion system F family protein [Chthoniobacter sp.]